MNVRAFPFSAAILVSAVSAQAASFDCRNAKSEIERCVCASSELSKADEGMAAAYRAVIQKLSPDGKKAVRHGQREWLAYIESYCSNEVTPKENLTTCLLGEYIRRKNTLKTLTIKRGGTTIYYVTRYNVTMQYDADLAEEEGKSGDEYRYLATDTSNYPQIDEARSASELKWNALMLSAYERRSPYSNGNDEGKSLDVRIKAFDRTGIVTDTTYYWRSHNAGESNFFLYYTTWMFEKARELRASDLFEAHGGWPAVITESWLKQLHKDYPNVPPSWDHDDSLRHEILQPTSWIVKQRGLSVRLGGNRQGAYFPEFVVPWADLKPFIIHTLPEITPIPEAKGSE